MAKKLNNKVYIAGPMRGIPYYNFPAFDEAAKRLKKKGFEPLNPADFDRETGFDPYELPEDWDWKTIPSTFSLDHAVKRDLNAIQEASYYMLLTGWEKSRGASAEKGVADWLSRIRLDQHTLEPFSETALQEAQRLVHGDRGDHYGHPLDDFTKTARFWEVILANELYPGSTISAEKVGLCMVSVKLSRELHLHKRDNLVDGAGYFETVNMIGEERNRRKVLQT